jgi:hypothetical protein
MTDQQMAILDLYMAAAATMDFSPASYWFSSTGSPAQARFMDYLRPMSLAERHNAISDLNVILARIGAPVLARGLVMI